MKTKTWIALLSALFALLCLTGFWLLRPGKSAACAEIRSEGQIVRTVSLSEDTCFTVTSRYGVNVVTVRDGAIGVTEASCPDHHCMARGQCSAGPDIICLPNQLVIKFSDDSGLDAVAGG